jgi:hypothetical protein
MQNGTDQPRHDEFPDPLTGTFHIGSTYHAPRPETRYPSLDMIDTTTTLQLFRQLMMRRTLNGGIGVSRFPLTSGKKCGWGAGRAGATGVAQRFNVHCCGSLGLTVTWPLPTLACAVVHGPNLVGVKEGQRETPVTTHSPLVVPAIHLSRPQTTPSSCIEQRDRE